MNKHVLYVSYDGLSDPLGQSQILPYILGLCKEGYVFHIISFEKNENFQQNRKIIEGKISELPITWHPLPYHKTPPILSTLYDLIRMNRLALSLVKSEEIVLTHCRSYLAGLIGLRLKQRLGIKFLFDIRGFWADERIDGGLWSMQNPIYRLIYRFFKKKEIEMMQQADHITSLTHAGKEEIASGNLFRGRAGGVPEDNITVIPCAVDMDLFDPTKISVPDQFRLKKELGLEKAQHILVYLGSIGTWYMLDEMLQYFTLYSQENPNSYFLFVTKDDSEEILVKARELGIDTKNIVVKGATREEVPLFLSIATLGLFFIKPLYSKKASSATKMGEMLAMGLDMVCNEIGDVSLFRTRTEDIAIDNLLPIVIEYDHNNKGIRFYELSNGIRSYVTIYDTLSSERSSK